MLTEITKKPITRRAVLRGSLATMLAAGAAPLLAACGGDDDDTDPTATAASGATTPTSAPVATPPPAGVTPTAGSEPAATATSPAATPTTPAEGATGRGGELISVHSNDADTLDPQFTYSAFSAIVFDNIFDTLIAKTPANEFEPLIAESWTIAEDGLIYTFVVREGIAFHDGSPVDAAAVQFTLDRATNPDLGTLVAMSIPGYAGTEVSGSEVTLSIAEPYAPLLNSLASSALGILPPDAVAELGDDFGQQPIGSGPWQFEEWLFGEQVSLVPNPNYVNFHSFIENPGPPLADRLTFRAIPEAQTQLSALETGEVNHMGFVPKHEVARLQADADDYTVYLNQGGTSIFWVDFATEPLPPGETGEPKWKAPFDDPRLRQAVGYALNPDEMIESVLSGLVVRNFGPMPTGLFPYDPAIEEFGYAYDPDQAAALLDEAGWTLGDDGIREKDGVKLEVLFWTWADPNFEKVVQVIQNQLDEVGIKVNIEVLEVGTIFARLPENVHDLNLMASGSSEGDVFTGLASLGWGIGNYRPADYMDMVVEARQISDQDERKGIYFDCSKRMLADAAMIPLWTDIIVVATRTELQGFKLGANNGYLWEDAWVAD